MKRIDVGDVESWFPRRTKACATYADFDSSSQPVTMKLQVTIHMDNGKIEKTKCVLTVFRMISDCEIGFIADDEGNLRASPVASEDSSLYHIFEDVVRIGQRSAV